MVRSLVPFSWGVQCMRLRSYGCRRYWRLVGRGIGEVGARELAMPRANGSVLRRRTDVGLGLNTLLRQLEWRERSQCRKAASFVV